MNLGIREAYIVQENEIGQFLQPCIVQSLDTQKYIVGYF